MKRLRHWLFNFAAAVSLVTCTLVTAVWVRSYWHGDRYSLSRYYYQSAQMIYAPEDELNLARGGVQFMHRELVEERFVSIAVRDILATQPSWLPADPPWQWIHVTIGSPAYPYTRLRNAIEGLGFAWWRGPNGGAGYKEVETIIVFPLWLPVIAFGLLPAVWLKIRHSARKRGQGLCPTCGYDLRATPDRCPECGAIPPAAKGSAT